MPAQLIITKIRLMLLVPFFEITVVFFIVIELIPPHDEMVSQSSRSAQENLNKFKKTYLFGFNSAEAIRISSGVVILMFL